MALLNLTKLTPEEINEAFANNGITEMEFTEVKFKEVDHFAAEYNYDAFWFDEDAGENSVSNVSVWIDTDLGIVMADCDGCGEFVRDVAERAQHAAS